MLGSAITNEFSNSWEISPEDRPTFQTVMMASIGKHICYICGSDGSKIAIYPILDNISNYECEKCHKWRLLQKLAGVKNDG